MGAMMLKQPGIALNEVEANRLATAIVKVQDQYPLVIDPRKQAWLNLAAIAGMIYAPRVLATINSRKENRTLKPDTEIVHNGNAEKAPPPKGPQTPADLFGPMSGAD